VNFRKTYYILPNLFTLSSVLCGFISICLSASGRSSNDLYLAALAICFGFFFDTFDGRVARLTKTQTDLGRDLDSLADVVTFGVAPALMVYKWGLSHYGRAGMLVAGLYVCAGTMRLARFNVLSRREQASGAPNAGNYTLGLTIPASASVLVFMVIVAHKAGQFQALSQRSIAGLVLVLSYLMVSRVRFRTFKDLRMTRKTLGFVLLLLGSYVAIVLNGLQKAFIFLLLISAHITLGLAEEVIFFRRRREETRKAALDSAAGSDKSRRQREAEQDAAAQDEEVLRELGAFDEPSAETTPPVAAPTQTPARSGLAPQPPRRRGATSTTGC